MIRTLFGGVVGGVALYLVSFLFWGTPLANLAFSKLDVQRNTDLQAALAAQLSEIGNGTYVVPWPGTPEGTILYGRGPVAMVHFTNSGFPVTDSTALLTGFILAIVSGVVIALALSMLLRAVPVFSDRARAILLGVLGIILWTHFNQPVFDHLPWGYFLYVAIADFAAVSAAALVIARWFLPHPAVDMRAGL